MFAPFCRAGHRLIQDSCECAAVIFYRSVGFQQHVVVSPLSSRNAFGGFSYYSLASCVSWTYVK